VELLRADARRAAVVLDEFAEGLARHVHARERDEAGFLPGGYAALEIGDVDVFGVHQDGRGALDQAVPVIDQHDARRLARHQAREVQLDAAERHRARPEQVILRIDEFLAHVDERELFAVREHCLDDGGGEGAEDDYFSCVMAGHSPSKTSVNALMSRPSTPCLHLKTWMPGTRPGMTPSGWNTYVACCGVIWCTSPVFRSTRMRLILSRLVPVTRTKRA